MSHIFISYSTKNKEYAYRLAEALKTRGYNIWIDNEKLGGGDDWWKMIVTALQKSAAFIVIMTPQSHDSHYVQTEVTLAIDWHKPIFPLHLSGDKKAVNWLKLTTRQIESVNGGVLPSDDFFQRLPEAARSEGQGKEADVSPDELIVDDAVARVIENPPPADDVADDGDDFDVDAAIDAFEEAEENEDWYAAAEWLRRIREHGEWPSIFLLDDYERDIAERVAELELQKERDRQRPAAERDYRRILTRIERGDPPERIAMMVSAFREQYDWYDPQDLRYRFPHVLTVLPPPFEWCAIPAGEVTLVGRKDSYIAEGESRTFPVAAFAMAKYPVTNAQFRVFWEAGGYDERKWWTDEGWKVREKENWTQPRYWNDDSKEIFNRPDHPVVGVSWYEAVAFCLWLSDATGENVMLPTEQQWQRAAQGDDERVYPWGDDWDCARCNNSVSPCNSKHTTPVLQYAGRDKGDSPFDVVDMGGNVWEWCSTDFDSGKQDVNIRANRRVLRGGSWYLSLDYNFRAVFRLRGNPYNWFDYWGFRIALS